MAQNAFKTSLFTKDGYFVGSIQFDLLLEESHSLESEVTEHPVEDGSVINDHINIKPRKGSLTGFVTNAPFEVGYNGGLGTKLKAKIKQMQSSSLLESIVKDVASSYSQTAQALKITKPVGITPDDINDGQTPRTNRVATVWDAFKALQKARQPVTIVTGLEEYKDVVVTRVDTSRDKETGDAGRFKVDFQEVRVVTLQEIGIGSTQRPNFKTAAGKQATTKKKAGKTGGKQIGTKKTIKVGGKTIQVLAGSNV